MYSQNTLTYWMRLVGIGALTGVAATFYMRHVSGTPISRPARAALAAPAPTLTIASDSDVQVHEGATGEYRFGSVDAMDGRVIRKIFTLRNNTTKPIIVTEARASCGCTKPFLSKNRTELVGGAIPKTVGPQTLRPNEAIYARFDLDLNRLSPGKIEKTVWIFTGETVGAMLKVSGAIQPDTAFVPANISFRSQRFGTSHSFILKAFMDSRLAAQGALPPLRSDDARIVVTPLPHEQNGLTATSPTELHNRSLVSGSYKVTLTSTKLLGPLLAHFRFAPAASDRQAVSSPGRQAAIANVCATVSGQVTGDFTAQPSLIILRPGSDAPEEKGDIALRAAVPGLLTHLRARTDNKWITARFIKTESEPATPVTSPLARPGFSKNRFTDAAETDRADSERQPYMRTLRLQVLPQAPSGPIRARALLEAADGQQLSLPVLALVQGSK